MIPKEWNLEYDGAVPELPAPLMEKPMGAGSWLVWIDPYDPYDPDQKYPPDLVFVGVLRVGKTRTVPDDPLVEYMKSQVTWILDLWGYGGPQQGGNPKEIWQVSGDIYAIPRARLEELEGMTPSLADLQFPRSAYKYYLRGTGFAPTPRPSSDRPSSDLLGSLTFELLKWNGVLEGWASEGRRLVATPGYEKPASTSYPGSGPTSDFWKSEAALSNSLDTTVGVMRLKKIANHLREAEVQFFVYRDEVEEYFEEGDKFDWLTNMEIPGGPKWLAEAEWNPRPRAEVRTIPERLDPRPDELPDKGRAWTKHQLNRYHGRFIEEVERQFVDVGVRGLSAEKHVEPWVYNVLLVDKITLGGNSYPSGLMYDVGYEDEGNLQRQGAAIAVGTIVEKLGGGSSREELKKAVAWHVLHELGHMQGIYHSYVPYGVGLMISEYPFGSPDPESKYFTHSALDAERLKHLPDHWIRPGAVPYGYRYRSTPLEVVELYSPTPGLDLQICECSWFEGGDLVLRMTNRTGQALVCPNERHAQPEYGRTGLILESPSRREHVLAPVHSPRRLGGLGNSSLFPDESIIYRIPRRKGWPNPTEVGHFRLRVEIIWAAQPANAPTREVRPRSSVLRATASRLLALNSSSDGEMDHE